MSELLNEVFEDSKQYPAINLKPKLKVPQLWQLAVPGNENLVVRMVSYMTEGDALKQVKQGDKYAHVILMSLSKNGTPAELKGGLGSDPIGAMNTIFKTVYDVAKKTHMDAIMFRFPAKKMVGQERAIQRVIKRLCMSVTGGRFVPLDAMYQFTAKHAYVLVYRKTKPLTDISGIPEINTELYTKVESNIGDVFVNKKSGDKVTKDEAIAGSIAAVESKRSDRIVINKTKLSRRALASIQSVAQDDNVYSRSAEFMDTAPELSRPVTAAPIPEKDHNEYKALVSGKSAAAEALDFAYNTASYDIRKIGRTQVIDGDDEAYFNKTVMGEYAKLIKSGESVNSVKALKTAASAFYKYLSAEKAGFIKRTADEIRHIHGPESEAVAEKTYNRESAKVLTNAMRDFVRINAKKTAYWYSSFTPEMSTKDRGAVKEYTTSSYDPINSYLLGRSIDENDAEVESMIVGLDNAFKNSGSKLPEGTTVYRGQKLRRPFFEKIVETRMYMFRNFVSTSLYPIMLGDWGANVSLAIAGADDLVKASDSDAEAPDFRDYTMQTNALGDPASPEYIEQLKYNEKLAIGWVISGADKINTIIPGHYSAHANECEVILPRGTVLGIDKITSASYEFSGDNQRMIEATVMTTEELSEAVVYDGDHLLETGEHVVVSGSESVGFASFTKAQRFDVMGMLAAMVNTDSIPQKFVL